MREIKFRAWHKFKKKMYKVYDLKGDSATGELCALSLNDDNAVGVNLFPCALPNVELMQYTGLKDKNGKEIWESDILLYDRKHLEHPVAFEVLYRCGGYAQRRLGKRETKLEDMPPDPCDSLLYEWNQLEVIGNKFDDPELLGGGE